MGVLKRLGFITSIPWTVEQGSGCYVGSRTLVDAITALGTAVERISPKHHFPALTLGRIAFNESLRWRDLSRFDATIGVDFDGYSIRHTRKPHIANIKGVLGDAVPFESGWAGRNLALQAALEKRHTRNSQLVITISRYCADRLSALYKPAAPVVIVPELIDLGAWRSRLAVHANPAHCQRAERDHFTVLCVARFFARKRIDLLLEAAAMARRRIRKLRVRVVGNGPGAPALKGLAARLGISEIVHWCGDVDDVELAREYSVADLFCLPSMQEGFGIVFLEAMAARKPILAARAAAVPEVVPHACLVEPGSAEALAEGLMKLADAPDELERNAAAGAERVKRYDSPVVAKQFLSALEQVA